MPSLCLFGGIYTAYLATNTFTLIWTHSIEKVRWEEDYQITAAGLVLNEARIQGSGAGMEIPPNSTLVKMAGSNRPAFWRYQPVIAPLQTLSLAASNYTQDYTLCFLHRCQPLRSLLSQRIPLLDLSEPHFQGIQLNSPYQPRNLLSFGPTQLKACR